MLIPCETEDTEGAELHKDEAVRRLPSAADPQPKELDERRCPLV
jgi:hypothetical protein